jgi:protein PhnA
VALIKDLQVTGSSTTLKMGTKVKSIRLVGGNRAMPLDLAGSAHLMNHTQ